MSIIPFSNESEILERLSEGDHLAFAGIYDKYWKKLLMHAWNHTKDMDLSEDIVHEVFMKLWDNRCSQQIVNIPGFLMTSIKFSIFNYYRKGKNREELIAKNLKVDNVFDGEAMIDKIFLEEYIQEVLSTMPDKCQLTFKLSRFEGMKNKEIADILHISEKGVEANLTRAIKFIKKRMTEDGLLLLISIEFINKYLHK